MDTGEPRRASTGPAVAALMTAFGLAGVGVAAAQDTTAHLWLLLPASAAVLVPGILGLIVLRRLPGHLVGWLLAAHALLAGIGMATPPKDADSDPVLLLGQLTQGAWVLLYVSLVLIAYVFPDGRFLSNRWRGWVLSCLGGYAAFVVGSVWDKDSFEDTYPGKELPLDGPPPWVTMLLLTIGMVLVVASLVGAVLSARAALRTASGDRRLQLLWFTWSALSLPAMFAVSLLDIAVTGSTDGVITILAVSAGGVIIPVGIGVGLLRYRLFDIELVLSRTLVYGALTVGVVGTYAAVLWAARSIVGNESTAGLVGVAVVAVAVQPAHQFLRRRIEHWVYGDRSDPVAALRRLSDRVEQTTDPSGVVQSVTDSVVEALRVDRAWVELTRDVGPPQPGDHVVRVPLVHRGQRLGDLAVEVPPGRQFTAADTRLLHDLARHAAVVVDAVHLTLDLQRSRARLVTAREEERRRLRRDMHDGLGPTLGAVVLKLNAVEKRQDAVERNRLLAEARAETRAAIDEVRRLVDDLRPPAIDEVGLIGAIRQRAAGLSRDDLAFDVGGPAVLPQLPAAVEVAAFRIAAEAMNNTSRHSGASRCTVHLAVNGGLELTVTDDGHGAPLGTTPGVGWTSMTERAAELGGSCTISSRAQGGTVVRAVLPLPAADPAQVEEVLG